MRCTSRGESYHHGGGCPDKSRLEPEGDQEERHDYLSALLKVETSQRQTSGDEID